MSTVYLIGAGPGDPGLLTIKGRDAIAAADVVIYDFLANPAFLALARPEAEVIYVGKKGGDHTLPQDKINELIIAKAREGKSVARLKGGDPYVFGRGGEEAEELVEAGVAFEVVPGVTSGVAGPAYAGIPVTHRDHCASVCLITGHEDPTKDKTSHDWEVFAKSLTTTLVFYMGVKNLPEISAKLIAGGRPAETPAALVRWGTTCNQKTVTGTLSTIAEVAKKAGISAPALLVVGGVVSLRDKLSWFEKRPLLGKGVVVTRAREQAGELSALLGEMGACAIEFPTIAIEAPSDPAEWAEADAEMKNLGAYDWLIFTSVNGVKFFRERLEKLGLDARALATAKVAAIGPATAESLKAMGITADFTPPKYVAESIVEGMLKLGVAGKKVLIPRARMAREILPEKLSQAGATVKLITMYETRLAESSGAEIIARLEAGEIQAITFASSSTVENFFALVPPEAVAARRDAVKLACIGPVTAETLKRFGFTPDVCPAEFTIPALANALVDVLK